MQKFGRVPCRSKDAERSYEDSLRQKVEKARKNDNITEVQYRSITSAAKDDDMGEAISKPRGVPSLLSGIV